jgi:hypothetical protein
MPELISTTWSVGKTLFEVIKFIDGKLSNKDNTVYKQFLRELTDYQVLTNAYEVEYAGSVIKSIENLRQAINSRTQELHETSKLEDAFFLLGEITRHFLTTVRKIERSIRKNLELAEENGPAVDASSKQLFATWKKLGRIPR